MISLAHSLCSSAFYANIAWNLRDQETSYLLLCLFFFSAVVQNGKGSLEIHFHSRSGMKSRKCSKVNFDAEDKRTGSYLVHGKPHFEPWPHLRVLQVLVSYLVMNLSEYNNQFILPPTQIINRSLNTF